jgi:PhzF family phenazine biosynthesis protein
MSSSAEVKAQPGLPFALVDVFASTPLSGNPLAVVGGGDMLTDEQMQRVAREFNQAETTFVLSPSRREADWRLRSFTATGVEVGATGHNALGAWWWLAESGRLDLVSTVTQFVQETESSVHPVEIRSDAGALTSVALTQSPPTFGRQATTSARTALAVALRLDSTDIDDMTLPIQVVSTGPAHLMVPIRDRGAIARARPDMEALTGVLASLGAQGCYLASLDPISPKAVAHTRFFNPTDGLYEDAATGSAAGPLACHLRSHGIIADGSTVLIEQGYALGRPSMLQVTLLGDRVVLSGGCVTSAEGLLRVA